MTLSPIAPKIAKDVGSGTMSLLKRTLGASREGEVEWDAIETQARDDSIGKLRTCESRKRSA